MTANTLHSSFQRVLHFSVIAAMLLSIFGSILPVGTVLAGRAPSAQAGQVPSAAVPRPLLTTAPETVVNTGGVSDYFRVGTVAYWHGAGSCYTPPASPAAQDVASASVGDRLEVTKRVSLIGAAQQRTLYAKDLRATNACKSYVFSRVVADENFVYWVDATGLVKLSKDANQGDAPQLVSASFNDQHAYEIAIGGDYIYLSRAYVPCTGFLCIPLYAILDKVNKNTGQITGLDCVLGAGCPYGHDLKVDPNGRYLYYLNASSTLYRKDILGSAAAVSIGTNVTAYYPEGRFGVGCPLLCIFSDKVFMAQGDHIISRDFEINSTATIYTSSSPTTARINDVISDKSAIFFFEVRQDVCTGCTFSTYTGWMFRSGRGNQTSLTNIYQSTPSIFTAPEERVGLDTDNVKLYWIEGTNLLRLSNQATALPKYPMHMTGIEVTQGVQTLNNAVPLIFGKRTFARVYVKSDDATHDVEGITARLQATWPGIVSTTGWTDWIEPTSVASITVKRSPKRVHLNDGFLFELPWDWVKHNFLQVRAELNPNHNPEESDGYANNILTAGPFFMDVSPRLEVRLFDYSYEMSGKIYSPDLTEDQGNIDWLTNAYPVSGSQYGFAGTATGLVWENFSVRDDALADLVRYPKMPCEDKDTTNYPNDNLPDCENLRASEYVNSQISGMRGGLENAYHDTDATSYYGLIPGGSEYRGSMSGVVTYFPRGLDTDKDASGPAGADYLGWYAGHEVGHSVGLGHPGTAGDTNECGIKGSDSYPTYAHAKIGTTDDTTTVMGFRDEPVSDTYPRYDDSNLVLASGTYDMMAYCRPQWISDQNYTRIFTTLAGYAPMGPALVVNAQSGGDWLAVYGGIYAASNTATISYLEHKVGTMLIPPITPGPYSIRLLNGSGATLADYAFTPASADDAAVQLYGQVVAFVAGTRKVQIIRASDQAVLGEHAISGSSPVVSSVNLVNPPNPVTGTVTLTWTASHPDGLPLTFNILYSKDNGVSFQPYLLHVTGSAEAVDTSKLGGAAAAKFRVVASDGANTAFADSPTFVMANKPPAAHISLPASDIKVRWGQMINFSGMGLDLQDGQVADANLRWTVGRSVLGTGPQITINETTTPDGPYALRIGVNTITLAATNSKGQTSYDSVKVTVTDDIEPDGPTLDVSPGVVIWNIASDVTATQSAPLNISNFGAGSLTWSVISDSTWLTVSAPSGVGGDTLTVMGDPTGMVNGETRSGTLTFTNTTAGSTQVITVPVSLVMGDIYQTQYSPVIPGWGIYLPVSIR